MFYYYFSGCDFSVDVSTSGQFDIPASTWNARWLSTPPSDHSGNCSAQGLLHLTPPLGATGVNIAFSLSADADNVTLHVADSPHGGENYYTVVSGNFRVFRFSRICDFGTIREV